MSAPTIAEIRAATKVIQAALDAARDPSNTFTVRVIERQIKEIARLTREVEECVKDIKRLHEVIRTLHAERANNDFAWEAACAEYPDGGVQRFIRYREHSVAGAPEGYLRERLISRSISS